MNNSVYPNLNIFQGVVEDIDDPKKMGRVRVRVFGIHSKSKLRSYTDGIPVDELPWAYVGQPVTSPAMNGIGQSPHILRGSWVYGFTRDGDAYQDLVVIGTIPGIPAEKPNTQEGFCDPSGEYPRDDHLGESDINRLARGENLEDTIAETKKDARIRDIPTADGGTWTEPAEGRATVYPKNHVDESEAGHIREVDDTEGAERIHDYHASGTFQEVQADGSRVIKVIGDSWEIFVANRNILVQGDVNVTVNGNAGVYVKGDSTVLIDGDERKTIKGNELISIEGNVEYTVSGNMTVITGGIVDLNP